MRDDTHVIMCNERPYAVVHGANNEQLSHLLDRLARREFEIRRNQLTDDYSFDRFKREQANWHGVPVTRIDYCPSKSES